MSVSQTMKRPAVPVFIATTVMLSFISFWRVAAIVLSDLASSAYYAGGDAEKVIGKSAPWFILAVMLFSYAVRAVYVESSSMFVRGGVYRVVKQAMGGSLAKFSVSALLFDYILTGPISGVSAGQYLAGFVEDVFRYAHHPIQLNENYFAAAFAIVIAVYFWWQNTKGMHESSDKAMKIMKITTVMVVILIVWCLITLLKHGASLPPLPSASNITRDRESLGWLTGTFFSNITLILLMVGFGHSVLAMSGEETLAQVNREIESPKLKNLKRAGTVIFVYSLLFTSLVSFFAAMIIPDKVRPEYFANLIGGLAMYLAGPLILKLLFHFFVVLVGVFILAGAVNTSLVGANGVLNRLVEDGVLTNWFQKPHKRFGTSYRTVNLIVLLQIVTIILSRGNVYLLAALYAFGVIWSFSFNALAVLVLRYKLPGKREWRVPFNPRIGSREFPLGVAVIALILFATAIVNLFTKEAATIAGISFSVVFYGIFYVSEHLTAKERAGKENLEQFRVNSSQELDYGSLQVHPGNILVSVRDPRNLHYLREVLHDTDTTKQDVVVMTARLSPREHSFGDNTYYEAKDVFETYEQELFSKVVAVAEKEGKPVSLLVVPGTNVFDTIMATAQRLESSRIVCGVSAKLSAEEQGKLTGDAWERLPEPKPRAIMEVVEPSGQKWEFFLGPHTPRLRDEDIELAHQMWLEITTDREFAGLHHYHIFALALQELQRELKDGQTRQQVLAQLRAELRSRGPGSA
jgi:amino acid transporter/nucleotide-binding universal stress UspA family protein